MNSADHAAGHKKPVGRLYLICMAGIFGLPYLPWLIRGAQAARSWITGVP